jgi:HPr kinase/phosphorylase
MVERQVPCLVLTRNFNPTRPMLAIAHEMNLPVFHARR